MLVIQAKLTVYQQNRKVLLLRYDFKSAEIKAFLVYPNKFQVLNLFIKMLKIFLNAFLKSMCRNG